MKNASLRKEFTIKRRQHLIETDYIDGVFNSDGEQTIRGLTEYEKQWLNQFNEETINADYSKHPEVKRLNRVKNEILFDDKVKKIMQEYPKHKKNSKMLNKLKKEVRDLKKQNIEDNQEDYDRVMRELEQVKRAVMLTYDMKSEIYKENKKRNEDLYNKANITGKLKSMNNINESEITESSIFDEDPEVLVSVFLDQLKE